MSHSFVTPWTVDYQDSLSMGFSRQEYWSGLSLPAPGDLPSPGMEPMSPALAGRFFTTETPGKPTTKDKLLNLKHRLEKIYIIIFVKCGSYTKN